MTYFKGNEDKGKIFEKRHTTESRNMISFNPFILLTDAVPPIHQSQSNHKTKLNITICNTAAQSQKAVSAYL